MYYSARPTSMQRQVSFWMGNRLLDFLYNPAHGTRFSENQDHIHTMCSSVNTNQIYFVESDLI